MVLNSTARGRSVDPVSVSRRRITSGMTISALAPALEGDRHMPPVVGQAGEVARQIIAADHVEHDIDPAPAGQPLHLLDEILAPVIDRRRRAEFQRARRISRRCRR